MLINLLLAHFVSHIGVQLTLSNLILLLFKLTLGFFNQLHQEWVVLNQFEIVESEDLYFLVVAFEERLVPVLDVTLDAGLVTLVVWEGQVSPIVDGIHYLLLACFVVSILQQPILLLLGLYIWLSQLICLLSSWSEIIATDKVLLHGILTLTITVPMNTLDWLRGSIIISKHVVHAGLTQPSVLFLVGKSLCFSELVQTSMSYLEFILFKDSRKLGHFISQFLNLVFLVSVLNHELLNLILNWRYFLIWVKNASHVSHQLLLYFRGQLLLDLELYFKRLVL